MPAGTLAGGGAPGPTDDPHVAACAGRPSPTRLAPSRSPVITILTARSTPWRGPRDADREDVLRKLCRPPHGSPHRKDEGGTSLGKRQKETEMNSNVKR